MDTLTRNKSYKAIAGAVFAFLVCAGSFVPTPVYAEFGSAELWALVNAGLVSSPAVTALKESVVEQYTSLSPGELTMLEYEIGAIYTVGSVVLAQDWASQYGISYNGLSGAYTVTGLCHYNKNDMVAVGIGSFVVSSESGAVFTSDGGSFALLPVDLNNHTPSVTPNTFGSGTRRGLGISYYCPTNGSDFDFAFLCDGAYDYHNGIGRFYGSYNNVLNASLRGFYGDPSWTSVSVIGTLPITWDEVDYTGFSFGVANLLNYISSMQYDEVSSPIDLYNQAYARALEDYPEYIDNWVDLEDDFNAAEPAVFDSLEFPPYIPDVDFHDVEVPSETFPTGLTDGAGFWFSAFSTMVDAFNLKSFVILFLCVMLVMVILKI